MDHLRMGLRNKEALAPGRATVMAAASILVWMALGDWNWDGHSFEKRAQADEPVAPSPKAKSLSHPFPRRAAAPPLEGGNGWLNTEKPLALADLRGKFVLLDFWTYCCINCMHILPELHKLEKAFPNELVVIGVHSAKFKGEKETDNIREAILRHHIGHPIVNDSDLTIWKRYGVRSWPTLVLIDPVGKVVWFKSGELTFEELSMPLRRGLPYYRKQGLVDAKPIHFALERDKRTPTPLLFPGKVLADAAGRRLFIADSSHHRIVVTSLEGTLIDVIGSGSIGRSDGNYAGASFNAPQGMALVGNMLYVADTENHLLRKVDLEEKRVETIAGTGEQARPFGPNAKVTHRSSLPLKTPLSSPWALWPHGRDLYIAMAGRHQIWKMPQKGGKIGPYAGNGQEEIIDGRLLPTRPFAPGYSAFAQPSGLASDGTTLFVADTEGSSIRAAPYERGGQVRTILGTSGLPGHRLFIFGDRDGKGPLKMTGPPQAFRGDPRQTTGALLQHAIGIAYVNGRLFIADTYNNKIKVLDLASGLCQTLAGTGTPGRKDGPAGEATFDEPAGLSFADGKLFIADTNSHAIRVIELNDTLNVSTLTIGGLEPPARQEASK